MAATLSKSAQGAITSLVDAAVKNPHDIPGATVAIANKNGEIIYQYSAGKAGVSTDKPVVDDSIYWLASCTKIIGTIVALQAVDEGLLSLDSDKDITKYAPELQNKPLIKEITKDGEFVIVPKKTKITLRHLLTHTAGLGYGFFTSESKQYADAFNVPGTPDDPRSVDGILNFEPGTNWQYSPGVDWALIVVSRAAGKSPHALLQENVLKPAGIKDITFRPDAEVKSRLLKMNYRTPDGTLVEGGHILRCILSDEPIPEADTFDSAGAGSVGNHSAFVKLLSIFLNKGVAHETGARILSEAIVKEAFTNQIPQWPDFGRRPLESFVPPLANTFRELSPQPDNSPQGWGLSWLLNTTELSTGRKPYSGYWCGLSNLYYWVDPESGIAAIVASQIFPFGDPSVLELFKKVEVAVYKGLEH